MTPIILAATLEGVPHHQILVNLSPEAPAQFASFERLIEVVGAGEAERAAGRERYRFYRERGYPLTHHDIGQSAKGESA